MGIRIQTTCRLQECAREATAALAGEGRGISAGGGRAGDRSFKARLEKVEKYDELPAIEHGWEDFNPLSYWHGVGSLRHDAHGNVMAPAQFPISFALA